MLRSWLCSDVQNVSSLRKIMIVAGHRSLSLCPHDSQACATFRRAAYALSSSTLRVSRHLLFSKVLIEISSAAQEEIVRMQSLLSTPRYFSSSLPAKAHRDVARSILVFWSLKFWLKNLHPKVHFSFLWPIFLSNISTGSHKFVNIPNPCQQINYYLKVSQNLSTYTLTCMYIRSYMQLYLFKTDPKSHNSYNDVCLVTTKTKVLLRAFKHWWLVESVSYNLLLL